MAALEIPEPLGYAPGDPVTSAQMNRINIGLPKAPNWVDGGATYNPADQLVMGGAGMRWTSETEFASTSTTAFESGAAVTNDGNWTVQNTGRIYVNASGQIVVQSTGEISVQTGARLDIESGGAQNWRDGSLITAEDGSTFLMEDGSTLSAAGIVNFGSTAQVSLSSGATLDVGNGAALTASSGSTSIFESGSSLVLVGNTTVGTTQPASSADPGGNNRIHATNLVKAWAAIQFNSGTATVLDGYNIASVTIDGSLTGVVTFARNMANTNYAVTYGCGGVGHQRKYATTQDTGKATSGFQFNVWSELAEAGVDLSDGATNIVVSICVMGRQ